MFITVHSFSITFPFDVVFSFLDIKVTAQDPFQYSDAFEANFAEACLCRGFQSRERRFYNLLPDASLCLFPFLTRSLAVLHNTFQVTLKHRQVQDLTRKTFHHDMYSRRFDYVRLIDINRLYEYHMCHIYVKSKSYKDTFFCCTVAIGIFTVQIFECLVPRREYGLYVIGPTVFMPPLPAFCSWILGMGVTIKHHKIHACSNLSPCPGWRSPGAFARPKPPSRSGLNSTDP